GSAKETTLRIDDTVTFKDGVAAKFGAQTAGAKAGETRTVDIRMTDAVADENLKGQTVQAALEVKDVKQQRLPELTEEFLQEHFVLQKIAEVEKIELDDEEIEAEIEAIADQVGETPRRVRAQYEREDMIETLAAQLIERKALNLVLESAQYEEVPMEQEAGLS